MTLAFKKNSGSPIKRVWAYTGVVEITIQNGDVGIIRTKTFSNDTGKALTVGTTVIGVLDELTGIYRIVQPAGGSDAIIVMLIEDTPGSFPTDSGPMVYKARIMKFIFGVGEGTEIEGSTPQLAIDGTQDAIYVINCRSNIAIKDHIYLAHFINEIWTLDNPSSFLEAVGLP